MTRLINDIQVTFTDLSQEVKEEKLLQEYNQTVQRTHQLFAMKYPDMFELSHLQEKRDSLQSKISQLSTKAGSLGGLK